MSKAKPFSISKRVVFESYKRVKANKGAAGVDNESIADFEEDLKNNLYKIWNRMSSGSYFPTPVREVGIGKDDVCLELSKIKAPKMLDLRKKSAIKSI